jgi:transcriptional regulator with XRE-family HTH domain
MTTPKLPHSDDLKTLGRALAELRKSAGVTQREASEQVGIRSRFISEVERGNRGMRWPTLLKVLGVYGSDLHDLADALKRAERKR